MAGRPINNALAVAKLAGDRTYEGSAHAACGTTTRYTSSGGCVFCARQKQTQMREALAEAQNGRTIHETFVDLAEQESLAPSSIKDLTPAAPSYSEPWD